MRKDYGISDADLEEFSDAIKRLWRIDLSMYRSQRLKRRLRGMMKRAEASDLTKLVARLREDRALSADLKDRFTINVTQFLRDPHLFATLEQALKHEGFFHNCHRLWSAGCSCGEEPYSLAILMDELAPRGDWQVLATDIDAGILREAEQAVFPAAHLKNVSPVRLRRYFKQVDEDHYTVDKRLRERVTFSALDLLKPAGRQPQNCDVILCRNVVIYFNTEATSQVHRMLLDSLRAGGLLFIGGTERLAERVKAQMELLHPFLYKKAAAA